VNDPDEEVSDPALKAEPRPSGYAIRRWSRGEWFFWIGHLLFFGGALLLQVVFFHEQRLDDAYISFRYGQNLATGHGFVFNVGERIMGSTSPGQCLLSAIVYLIAGRDAVPSIMAAIGCASWTAIAIATRLHLHHALGSAGALIVAGALLLDAARNSTCVAMETNTVIALNLWAIWCAQQGRWRVAALLSGLACVFRPDAAIVALLLASVCVWKLRRPAWAPCLVFAGVVLPWLTFAFAYFGTVIPQSAVTKFHVASLEEYARNVLESVPRAIAPFDPMIVGADPLTEAHQAASVLMMAWLVVAVGMAILWTRDRRTWILIAYALLHFGAYLYLRPFVYHTWHIRPAITLCTIAVVAVLAAGIRLPFSQVVRGAAVVGVALLLLGYAIRLSVTPQARRASYWSGRHAAYVRTAEYLRPRVLPTEIVASTEVGTIAYYSNLPMFDKGLLVSDRQRLTAEQASRTTWLVHTLLDRGRYTSPPVHMIRERRFEVAIYRVRFQISGVPD